MDKQNKQPMGMLEALGARAEELPEQTQDELVEQALAEAKVEQMTTNLEEPPIPSSTKPLPKKEIPTIPASSIDSQPAIQNSILGLVSQGGIALTLPTKNDVVVDKNLQRLKEYVRGEEFSINWVRLHLSNLGRIPNVIPVMNLWDVPASLDIPKAVHDVVLTDGYLDNIWPSLSMVMGSSKDNLRWTAGVLTSFALFDTIRFLSTYKEKQ